MGTADLLIAELQDPIRALNVANREDRRLIAALTSRMPLRLEAPQEATDGAETVEQEPEGAEKSPGPAPQTLRRGHGGRGGGGSLVASLEIEKIRGSRP
jgi:hypothetical protein